MDGCIDVFDNLDLLYLLFFKLMLKRQTTDRQTDETDKRTERLAHTRITPARDRQSCKQQTQTALAMLITSAPHTEQLETDKSEPNGEP